MSDKAKIAELKTTLLMLRGLPEEYNKGIKKKFFLICLNKKQNRIAIIGIISSILLNKQIKNEKHDKKYVINTQQKRPAKKCDDSFKIIIHCF